MSDAGFTGLEFSYRAIEAQIENEVLPAAQVAAGNLNAVEQVVDTADGAGDRIREAVESLSQTDERLTDQISQLRSAVDDHITRVHDTGDDQSSSGSGDSAGDSASASGGSGPSLSDLGKGLLSFFDSVGSLFNTTKSHVEQATAVEKTVQAAASEVEHTVAAAKEELTDAPVIGGHQIGEDLTTLASSFEEILATFDELGDSAKKSPEVVTVMAEVEKKHEAIVSFQKDMANLTKDFDKPLWLERLRTVSTLIGGVQKVQEAIDVTKIKNILPTENWAEGMRQHNQESRSRCLTEIEKGTDAIVDNYETWMFDQMAYFNDQDDRGYRMPAQFAVMATSEVVTEKAIKKLDTIGDVDLVDGLAYGAKWLGGPVTKGVIEKIESGVDSANIALGSGVTATRAWENLKAWAENGGTGDSGVGTEAIDRLADVVAADGTTIKEKVLSTLKEAGEKNRAAVLEHWRTSLADLADKDQQRRLAQQAERAKTREEEYRRRGDDLRRSGEQIKRKALKTVSALLPATTYDIRDEETADTARVLDVREEAPAVDTARTLDVRDEQMPQDNARLFEEKEYDDPDTDRT